MLPSRPKFENDRTSGKKSIFFLTKGTLDIAEIQTLSKYVQNISLLLLILTHLQLSSYLLQIYSLKVFCRYNKSLYMILVNSLHFLTNSRKTLSLKRLNFLKCNLEKTLTKQLTPIATHKLKNSE